MLFDVEIPGAGTFTITPVRARVGATIATSSPLTRAVTAPPLPAATSARAPTSVVYTSPSQILLNADGTIVLSPTNLETLNNILTYLKQNKSATMTLPAQSIQTWLVNHGVAASRLSVPAKPAAAPALVRLPTSIPLLRPTVTATSTTPTTPSFAVAPAASALAKAPDPNQVLLNPDGSVVLSPANMATLNSILTYLKQNKTVTMALPAASIMSWLTLHGIPASRLSAPASTTAFSTPAGGAPAGGQGAPDPNQVLLNPDGSVVLSPANMALLNGLLTYLNQNKNATMVLPAQSIFTWLTLHGISASRLTVSPTAAAAAAAAATTAPDLSSSAPSGGGGGGGGGGGASPDLTSDQPPAPDPSALAALAASLTPGGAPTTASSTKAVTTATPTATTATASPNRTIEIAAAVAGVLAVGVVGYFLYKHAKAR